MSVLWIWKTKIFALNGRGEVQVIKIEIKFYKLSLGAFLHLLEH